MTVETSSAQRRYESGIQSSKGLEGLSHPAGYFCRQPDPVGLRPQVYSVGTEEPDPSDPTQPSAAPALCARDGKPFESRHRRENDGNVKFSLESVKKLKELMDENKVINPRMVASKASKPNYSPCQDKDLPEEFQPVCKREDADAIFQRLCM
ncbi:hypothetical protein ASZ78_002525 [Callipepla squamata]|uniref:Guanylate cyclase activator 2B n=1 Tax=Callipepla squamata TaxID=9009 RepID=A0A226MAU6_CALSU|nr:hypothetical protein ASZ78_014859 [Callipepla squamata]OXB52417.1 hypothetical protein ASZ78_002525 [Callipepla squamata]